MLDWIQVQAEYDEQVQKLSNSNLETRERAALQKKASFYSSALDIHKQIDELEKNIERKKNVMEFLYKEISERFADIMNQWKE